jgi:hypothetical protein
MRPGSGWRRGSRTTPAFARKARPPVRLAGWLRVEMAGIERGFGYGSFPIGNSNQNQAVLEGEPSSRDGVPT